MPNTIPQSQALAEANPNESWTEAVNRFDYATQHGLQHDRKDLNTIISEMRNQRLRWDAAEKAGVRVRNPKVEGGNLKSKVLESKQSADELGL